MIKKHEQLTISEIITLWKGHYYDDKSRYSYSNWPHLIRELAEKVYKNGHELDDFQMHKKEVCNFLLTEDGRKGKGKHSNKNWLENVNERFDLISTEVFLSDKANRFAYGPEYSAYNEQIVGWVERNFDKPSDTLIKEAHLIGGFLWNKFMQETFFDKRDGKEINK